MWVGEVLMVTVLVTPLLRKCSHSTVADWSGDDGHTPPYVNGQGLLPEMQHRDKSGLVRQAGWGLFEDSGPSLVVYGRVSSRAR